MISMTLLNFYVHRMDAEARKRLVVAIKKARGRRSQRQFATDLNVSYGAVQAWERGDSVPGVESLQAIAISLGQTLDELLAYAQGASPEELKHFVAEDVLIRAEQLSQEEQGRLIKLLVDRLVQRKKDAQQ